LKINLKLFENNFLPKNINSSVKLITNFNNEFKNIFSKKATLLVKSMVRIKNKIDINNCLNIIILFIAKRDL
tara:strand:+ start:4700 stop:4915 length:216 start_codon:yes stop_codon:yes gene_type:complete